MRAHPIAAASLNRPWEEPSGIGIGAYPRLRIGIVLVWLLFVAFSLWTTIGDPPVLGICAAAIATAAVLPTFLWTGGRHPGLPVVPIHLLTLLWTFALPLITGHPEIENYQDDEIAFASFSVVLYALAATTVWVIVSRMRKRSRSWHRVLPGNRGFAFFIASLFAASVFIALALSGRLLLAPGVLGIVRSSILAFASIATFVLALRLGQRELNVPRSAIFLLAVTTYITVQLATLLMVGAIVTLASALIGYTVGRGRVPWMTIVIAIAATGILQFGKSEMRARYWEESTAPIQVWDLPRFFAEWTSAGVRGPLRSDREHEHQSIYERLSLMHLLLLVERFAPDAVPYLGGATYAIIPRLLVPRIIDPEKPDSHEGTAMLNIHFGIQTFAATETTTVGWGPLNEAYANFGLAGVVAVGVLLSLLYSWAGRLTLGAPLMSLSNMVAVTICAVAIQAEFTMAVLATVLFQSLVVLCGILPFLERRRVRQIT